LADTKPCHICGKPTFVSTVNDDGTRTYFCADHLSNEAREVYEELRAKGWDTTPPKPKSVH
jgi:hypothetical protein